MTPGIFAAALAALAVQAAPMADSVSQSPQIQPASSEEDGYVLGAADKIKIVVFEEASLSGVFSVAGNGNIAFPLVGPVKALGLTPQQLEASIRALLDKGYLKDPRVNVEVLTFRPYYILGEVGRPGEYPFSSGLTALNAVATAGGFSYRANRNRVFIKRVRDTVEHPETLTPTTVLGPGDTLRIGERFF